MSKTLQRQHGFVTALGVGAGTAGTAAALVVLASGLTGCSAGAEAKRPILEASAMEITAANSADAMTSDLDFFDALESRRLVCQDDVLHAALLLGNGESAPNYPGRIELARRLGYVDSGFARPAREAATLGEVARTMLRVTDGAASTSGVSQEQALLRMAGRGLMPAQAKPYQGLTGAQFVTVLGGVRDAMGDRERPRLRPAPIAAAPVPAPASQAAPAAIATEPVPTGASAVASVEGGAGALSEPLPASVLDAAIEKPAMVPVKDTGERSTPQPSPAPPAEVSPASEPAPAAISESPVPVPPPPPSPTKPRAWVPGKPLRKSGQ